MNTALNNTPIIVLRDYSEIIEQLEIAQKEEDAQFGDMGHQYYQQAITAIQDLDAALMDLAADYHRLRMRVVELEQHKK